MFRRLRLPSILVALAAIVLGFIAWSGNDVTRFVPDDERLAPVQALLARRDPQLRSVPSARPSVEATTRLAFAARLSHRQPGVFEFSPEGGRDAADEFLVAATSDPANSAALASSRDLLLDLNETNFPNVRRPCDTCLDSLGGAVAPRGDGDTGWHPLAGGGSGGVGGVGGVGGYGLSSFRGDQEGSLQSSFLPIVPGEPSPSQNGPSSTGHRPGSHEVPPSSHGQLPTVETGTVPEEPVTVPEPTTLALVAVGVGAVAFARARRAQVSPDY
jgi:hypothetical protein